MILTVYNSLITSFSNNCVVGVYHILDVKYPLQAPMFEELVVAGSAVMGGCGIFWTWGVRGKCGLWDRNSSFYLPLVLVH